MERNIIKLSLALFAISAVICIITFTAGKSESFRLIIKSIVDKDVELFYQDREYGKIYQINILYNMSNVDIEYYCDDTYMQKGTREATRKDLSLNIKNLMQEEVDIKKTVCSLFVETDTILYCRVEAEESEKIFMDFFKFDKIREKVEIVKLYAEGISLQKSTDLAVIIYYGERKDYQVSSFGE